MMAIFPSEATLRQLVLIITTWDRLSFSIDSLLSVRDVLKAFYYAELTAGIWFVASSRQTGQRHLLGSLPEYWVVYLLQAWGRITGGCQCTVECLMCVCVCVCVFLDGNLRSITWPFVSPRKRNTAASHYYIKEASSWPHGSLQDTVN